MFFVMCTRSACCVSHRGKAETRSPSNPDIAQSLNPDDAADVAGCLEAGPNVQHAPQEQQPNTTT